MTPEEATVADRKPPHPIDAMDRHFKDEPEQLLIPQNSDVADEAMGRTSSPADGPAKVFGRAPLPTSAMPGEATHILALENLCFQWFAGNGVYLDADKDSSGNAEALAIATLSALLSLIPAEQVVQAMGEETRRAVRLVLDRERSGLEYWTGAFAREKYRADEAEAKLDTCSALMNEALARAEKAERLEAAERLRADANEELLVIAGRSGLREKERAATLESQLRSAVEDCDFSVKRAEQAERERDEAKREIQRLRTGAVAGVSSNVTVGTPPRDVPSHAFRHQTSRGTDAWFWFGHISYTEDGHTFISWPASSDDDLPAMYRAALRETHAPLPQQTSKAVTYNG